MCSPQSYAVQIEHIMSRIFACDRFGVGGLVNSDYIRRHPFATMMCTLTKLYDYPNGSVSDAVAGFFDSYSYYGDWSINELLSFETNSKVINGTTFEIGFENGKKAIEEIISKFSVLCEQYG